MGWRGKNFAVCPDGTHGKVFDLPSVQMGHTANQLFAECKKINTRQINCLPSVFFCRVFFWLHSVNQLFAECSR